RGSFEVRPVGCGLLKDFLLDDLAADSQPSSPGAGAPEEAAEKHEAHAVAQVVVPVDVALLEVLDDELAVQEQRPQEAAAEGRIPAGLGRCEKVESPDPADGAQCDV